MLNFNDYRKKQIQESIQSADSFADMFDQYFNTLRLDLLNTLSYSERLTESVEDQDLLNVANYALKLTVYEDYCISNEIISHYVVEARRACGEVVTEAASDIDSGISIDQIKANIAKEVQRIFKQIKTDVTKIIKQNRMSGEIHPSASQDPSSGSSAMPPVNAPSSAPSSSASQVPSGMSQSAPQGTSGQNMPPVDPSGKIGVPKRKGFFGWLKNMVSPSAWKTWWKSREGMSRMRDLMAHDPKFANMINKRWDQKFQYEDFAQIYDNLLNENDNQLVSLMNSIDEFSKQLVTFIQGQIDKYVASTSAAPTAPTAPTAPITAEPKPVSEPEEKPLSDEKPEPEAAVEEPPVAVDEPSVEEPAATIKADEPPPEVPEKPKYAVGNVENSRQDFLSGQIESRRAALEAGLVTPHALMKKAGTAQGKRELHAYAKALGYPDLPRSSKQFSVEDLLDVVKYVQGGLNHLGLLGDDDGARKVTAPHKGREIPKPAAKPEPQIQPEKVPEVKPSVEPEPVAEKPETPVADTNSWQSVELDDESDLHPSMLDDGAAKVYKTLKQDGLNSEDARKAMMYYWDKYDLNSWIDNEDKYLRDLNQLVGTKNGSKPAPEPKPEPTPEPTPEPVKTAPEPKPEPTPEPVKPESQGTPSDLVDKFLPSIQQKLRDDYTPSVDSDHLVKFMNNTDVTPFIKKDDFDGLVNAFSKFQGVDLKKKEAPTPEPEPEDQSGDDLEDLIRQQQQDEDPMDYEDGYEDSEDDYNPNSNYYSYGGDDEGWPEEYDDEDENY